MKIKHILTLAEVNEILAPARYEAVKKNWDRRGNLWVKSMDSGGVEETT